MACGECAGPAPSPPVRFLSRQVRDRSTFYAALLGSEDEALIRRLISDVSPPPLHGVEAALAQYAAAADFSAPFNLARAVVAPAAKAPPGRPGAAGGSGSVGIMHDVAPGAAAADRAAGTRKGSGVEGKRGEAAMYAELLNSMPQFAAFGKVRRRRAPPSLPLLPSPPASCLPPSCPPFLRGVGCIERVATVALPFPQRPQTWSGAKLAGRRRVTPSIKPTKACIGDVWGGGSSSRRRRRWS
jgi:hypothetical protein